MKGTSGSDKIRTIPIARALSALLIFGFGIFAIVVSVLIQKNMESDFTEIRTQDFERRMAAYATLLDNFIEVHQDILNDISTDTIFTQSVMQPEAMLASLGDHMGRLKVLGKPAQISLLAYDGSNIHSSLPYPNFNYQDDSWITEIIEGKPNKNLTIHYNGEDSFFTFASPIYYNNIAEGVLLAEIPVETLLTNYQWSQGLNEERLEIYYDNKRLISLGNNEITNGQKATIELNKYGLTISGHLNDNGLLAIRNSFSKQLITTVFLLAIFGVMATFFITNKLIIVPLDTLRKATNMVAKGQFRRRENKDRAADELPNNYRLREIYHLRNDISEMASTIVKREHSLLEAKSRLEHRVEERTSELKMAHDEALVATNAKSGFLATMSHEIRTPINAILGILDILKSTHLNSDQLSLVKTCRESGELLHTLINDILDFSKMEAGKFSLQHRSFDLHQLLTQIIELFAPMVNTSGVKLILDTSADLPCLVSGDPDRLRQIIINLTNNALKFTEDGSVTLHVYCRYVDLDKFNLYCEVRDTGMGIPEGKIDILFDEFTMADQSHSRTHEGTGLGLAICRRLVTLMNGSISATSTLGQGSTFFFDIELKHALENDVVETVLSDFDIEKARNTRILLAEDNAANQMVISRLLETTGLQVDIVSNGRKAVEAVATMDYDIVLMDISMPEMDGMDATRAIRSLNNARANIPIIALTAHALPGDKEYFLESGMNDYLTKPINRDLTVACIARWCDREPLSQATSPPLTIAPEVPEAKDVVNYIDEPVLYQLIRDTSEEIFTELISGYIIDSQDRLSKIRDALNTEDIKTIEFETHTLGSSAGAHGNSRLFEVCRKIEDFCRENNPASALKYTAGLEQIAVKSFEELASWQPTPAPACIDKETL